VKLTRYSIRITWRFALVLAVLLPALAAVTAAGIYGLDTGRRGAHSLYEDHLQGTLEVASLQSALQDVHRASLELLLEDDAAQRGLLSTTLTDTLIPAVQRSLGPVAALSAQDPQERSAVQSINASWAQFVAVLAEQLPTATTPAAHVHVEDEINAEFARAVKAAKSITSQETHEADLAYQAAQRDYDFSIELMLIAGLTGLLCSIATVIWLIRSVLPRTLAYSAFATEVGQGDYSRRLHPEGHDELAQLGQALDELAERRQAEATYDRNKLELIDALQLTESEQDAHELLQRHLERVIPDGQVTVLNRHEETDRLQAMTPIPADSPLLESLKQAKPRSCLAIRKARPHATAGGTGRPDLLPCPVCSSCAGRTSCEPLIVSGEVIGSVLTTHPRPLSKTDQRAIREAVTQAAPVIGNLRNLAGAEMRALTDGLTGLPNRRAITNAVQRLVARSLRAHSALAVLMCDIDHFKAVNDQYGHGRGDDVLKAVGAVLAEALRPADFAGRYGGEEFLVVLPDTRLEPATAIAERIRAAVAAIQLPGLEHRVTLSVGVAVMPDHGQDAASLESAADRALYAAKNGGRDRVEVFAPHLPPPPSTDPAAVADEESSVIRLRSPG
jgi:diguanylate cyclase (GGDEF)-like protein